MVAERRLSLRRRLLSLGLPSACSRFATSSSAGYTVVCALVAIFAAVRATLRFAAALAPHATAGEACLSHSDTVTNVHQCKLSLRLHRARHVRQRSPPPEISPNKFIRKILRRGSKKKEGEKGATSLLDRYFDALQNVETAIKLGNHTRTDRVQVSERQCGLGNCWTTWQKGGQSRILRLDNATWR